MKAKEIFQQRGLTDTKRHGFALGAAYRCDKCPATFARAQQLYTGPQMVKTSRHFLGAELCVWAYVLGLWRSILDITMHATAPIRGRCLEKLFLHVDPVQDVDLPPGLQRVPRLLAHQTAEPATFEAQNEHHRALQDWQAEWKELGLPSTARDNLETEHAAPHELSQWIIIRWYRERMRDTRPIPCI